ncbi:MAG TPA: asparagine synthase-related protein [Sphingobium sp.]|uniref:asparagine synthase-related protein n=1 Tax=Sphingobium sp. TaxID=1912891 RepID=UPI002ED29094
MSLRYLLLTGAPEQLANVKLRLARLSWVSVADVSPRSLVAVTDPTARHLLPGEAGVVIGTLFRRDERPQPLERLNATDIAAIHATDGGHLLWRLWGSYILLLDRPDQTLVLRDPSGMLPCHYLSQDGLHIFASDPDLLVEAGFLQPRLDEFGLARALYLPGLPTTRTAIEGVNDLLPGTALTIRGTDISLAARWSPWNHVRPGKQAGFEANAAHLRDVVGDCVSAWGGILEPSLVGLSGGLDSSIVAAALTRAGHLLSCLTLVTDDPLGDERSYCRALAEHFNLPLEEAYYSLADVPIGQSSVGHRVRPYGRPETIAYDAAAFRVAERNGAKAVLTGHGGDNIFYFSYSARAIADRFLVEGLSSGLRQTVLDICTLTGASVFEVAWAARKVLKDREAGYAWRPDETFLARELIQHQSALPIHHDWLVPPKDKALPGKAAHIAMLLRMQHSVEGHDRSLSVPVIHPLASQPLVEFCLSIPTWQQCAGGYNRSVARRAFASELPATVANRRGKGSPEGFAFEILRHFRSEIRERLLDGQLVKAQLLDGQALEIALRPDARNTSKENVRLLALVDAEAWAQRWIEKGEAAANAVPHDASG